MRTLDEIKALSGFTIVKTGPDGGHGVVHHKKLSGSVIWSFGGEWEHVSVAPFDRKYTPNWDDMCWLKELFFRDDEVAVQFHPPKSEYVNNLGNCLHLWRLASSTNYMPMPPSWMVGIKGLNNGKPVR